MSDAERIAQLEAEVAWLRSELAIATDLDAAERLKRHFGIRYGEALILWTLYQRRGRALTCAQLSEFAVGPRGREDRHPTHLKVVVCRLRKKIGRASIETCGLGDYRGGYRLTHAGRQLIAPIGEPASSSGLAA